jgi:trimeric autotransporter adhesin
MKKHLLSILLILFMSITSNAQVSGTFTIPSAEYPTIESAIAALNAQGVGLNGAIFNITAGYTETFTSPLAGVLTTSSTEATKPIIFQKAGGAKSGSGDNPVITAGVGTTTAIDAIFALAGTDYVTFDGITIRDNPANANSITRMEYGFWLARGSATNGTQYVTIRNCKIFGLEKNYAIASTNYTLSNLSVTPTSQAGTNSYIKIYSDSIINTTIPTGNKLNQQVYFTASSNSQSSGFWDEGNEIGVDGGNFFLNCMYLNCMYQRNLKIKNNLFTSIDPYPVTTTNHISTSACPNLKISNNTFGNFSLLTSLGGYKAMNVSATDSLEITNNLIQNINYGNTPTGAFTGIDFNSNAAYIQISGNSIINNTVGGSSTTTGSFIGISIQSGNMVAGSFCNINDNIISGNVITSSSAAVVNSYIKNYWYGWMSKIYNNTITNNTASCNGTTHGIDAQCITANLIEKRIYGNTIANLMNTNGTFHGIRHVHGLRTYIYKNNISNISLTGTLNPVINGITLDNASSSTVYIFNNYISELKTPQSSGNRQITGLNIAAGQLVDAYYNTIYLDAASTMLNFGTAGIYAGTLTIVKLRNNSVVNLSVPGGTGKTVALYYGGTSLGNFDPTSNNNNYYIGTPDTNKLVYYNGTNSDQTLQSFQSRVMPAENASVTEFPPFTDVVNSPYNLHLSGPSQCESGGIPVLTPEAVTDDFYGTPRYPNPGYPLDPAFPPTRPDIGAEEFGGIWKDFSPPTVTLTPLPNTASTFERVLTTTINDLTGVPTSGSGMPVLYWNINNGAWNTATAVYNGGNQYEFTFGNGALLNDSIQYFIVAQDMVSVPGPNVGSTPVGASGCTINPPLFTTPPVNPFKYKIVQGLCGTFTVGSGGNYTTLTAAINDLNSKAVSCSVTLLLTDPLYVNETFPININAIKGLSEQNTLTIRPAAGVTPVIKGSCPTSLISLNGVKYLTIDGSNSGGSDRSLLLYNSNSTASARVIFISSTGGMNTGSTDCVIKNCKIKGSPQVTNTTYGIVTSSATGGGYNNIVIDNNEIYSARIGVRIQGTLAYPATNCKILNNVVGSPIDSISIQLYGLYNLYADNTLIEGNDVMGTAIAGNDNLTQMGISIYTLATNTKIKNNKVHGFFNRTLNYGAQGIQYRAEGYTVTEISNNVIYDIKGPGSAAVYQDIAGISVLNGGNVKIWHNSINLSGDILSPTNATKSGCIILSNAVTNVDIRNNVMVNTLRPSSGSPASKTFGIYSQGPASIISVLNNNDYYINGINPYIGELNLSNDYPTLAEWQTGTGQEANSLNVDPVFTSPGNLLPTTTAMPNAGVYIPGVPQDITGLSRTNPPDMGAYEFSVNPLISTLAASDILNDAAMLNGSANATGTTFDLFFDWGLTSNYGNTAIATPVTITGTSLTPVSASLNGLNWNTTYHYRARGVTSGGLIVYGSDMTFTTTSSSKTLNLKVFLEGLNVGVGVMSQAMDGNTGLPQFGPDIADQVTVELHNATYPYAISSLYPPFNNVDLKTNGEISISTLPGSITGSYYVVIKHRNSIETWSMAPVQFGVPSPIQYDFTTAASKAFGDNLRNWHELGVFVIYGGDVNQDGIIDSGDMNSVENASVAITFGYVDEDANGDGIVDSGDMNIVENNSMAIVTVIAP